jgi:hypothetical protein
MQGGRQRWQSMRRERQGPPQLLRAPIHLGRALSSK